MHYSLISIVIASYNSAKTIGKTLESIKGQKYPEDKIEILIVDGGSTDITLKIAKKYNCRIILNPKIELIYAKHLGYLNGKGKYLMFLDSDEILENPNSLYIKYSAFKKYKNIKSVMLSGYKTATDSFPLNNYINEFGDPFSFFVYKESKDHKFLIKEWSNKYIVVDEDKKCIVFNFYKISPLPLIDLFAGGCMIDLNFCKSTFPELKDNPNLIPLLFYLLNSKKTFIAVTKEDNTIHYPAISLRDYLKKISSRVRNNIFCTLMGQGGFIGREKFQTSSFRLKKIFFIPYTLTLVLPLADSIYLAKSRNNTIYLTHLPLCLYTTAVLIYYFTLKLLGIKPELKTYGK